MLFFNKLQSREKICQRVRDRNSACVQIDERVNAKRTRTAPPGSQGRRGGEICCRCSHKHHRFEGLRENRASAATAPMAALVDAERLAICFTVLRSPVPILWSSIQLSSIEFPTLFAYVIGRCAKRELPQSSDLSSASSRAFSISTQRHRPEDCSGRISGSFAGSQYQVALATNLLRRTV